VIEDKAIGGYFELELPKGEEFHAKALALNTGRNAFEYVLLAKQYKKIYLPYFTCDVMLEPLVRNNISYVFYNIDENFEPLFDYSKIEGDAAFLYTNYFALKDKFIKQLALNISSLIIDNAQSFYSKPLAEVDTFYSPRKFFGIPDGGYLYTNTKLNQELKVDSSEERCHHLLKRIDSSAEEGYLAFISNDKSLENNPIKKMSALTSRLLLSINYQKIANIRKENLAYLHASLSGKNKLKFDIQEIGIPLVYPFWATKELRVKLLESKIYTATYWPNVKKWCNEEDLEYKMMDEIIYLPIDQRQTKVELIKILKIIAKWK
jgi:hypothetical protein